MYTKKQKNIMQILEEIVSSEEESLSNKMMIQNTSNIIKQYLDNKVTGSVLQVLEWPTQSPDMSSIEAICQYLEKQRRTRGTQLILRPCHTLTI